MSALLDAERGRVPSQEELRAVAAAETGRAVAEARAQQEEEARQAAGARREQALTDAPMQLGWARSHEQWQPLQRCARFECFLSNLLKRCRKVNEVEI